MKRLMSMLFAGFLLAAAMMVVGATSASATQGGQFEGKKQTICHFTNENAAHPYVKIEVDVNSILNELPSGHQQHDDGADIIPPFSYYEKINGEWVLKSFPGQGDQSLLAFEHCEEPEDDVLLDQPAVVYADPCVTKNDVFSVAPGANYTVGDVVVGADSQSITVTAADGFLFKPAPGTKTVTFTKPLFTNVDCDLPETGSAEYAVAGGVLAVLALALGGYMFVRGGRNKATL